MVKELFVSCDGGSRGNPGPAAIGVVVRKKDGFILYEHSERIGETTNNVAEYTSLLKALSYFDSYSVEKGVIEMDSQLIVKQVNGEWRTKADHLRPLRDEAQDKLQNKKIELKYVPRSKPSQAEADALVNKAFTDQL